LTGCVNSTLEQALRPDQPMSVTTDLRLQDQNRPGLVVTDNPYTISSDRLEKMNKGGFEAY
jgi:hypothetical protein